MMNSNPLIEALRQPYVGILNGDYEVKDDDKILGKAKIDDNVISMLEINTKDTYLLERTLNALLTLIVREADYRSANLSVQILNNVFEKLKYVFERYGFKHVGKNIMKRNAGSIVPPPVLNPKVVSENNKVTDNIKKSNEIRQIGNEIGEKYGIYFNLGFINDDTIKLFNIIVPKNKRKEGLGSAAIKDLINWADNNNKMILLDVGSKDKLHGTTSKNRLLKFYRRFGFIRNFGRRKRYELSAGMYRLPKK